MAGKDVTNNSKSLRLMLQNVQQCLRRLGPTSDENSLDRLFSQLRIRSHLVVMRQPYLRRIIAGEKRLEARLSKHRCAPYGQVQAGDVLLLKRVGGPVVCLTTASQV